MESDYGFVAHLRVIVSLRNALIAEFGHNIQYVILHFLVRWALDAATVIRHRINIRGITQEGTFQQIY